MQILVVTGVKFVVERQDGEITTWHDVLDEKVEDILRKKKKQKAWQNGIVTDAYIEFNAHGEYYKVYLDCKRLSTVLAEQ